MTERAQVSKERLSSKRFGVVIFILDSDNRVLTIVEQDNKESTGKVSGKYGCICETREQGEASKDNARRGFVEELGMKAESFADLLSYDDQRTWETKFVDGVWAAVIVQRCINPDKLMRRIGSNAPPHEVEVVGWKTRDEFEALDLRSGVRNIVNNFGDEIFGK